MTHTRGPKQLPVEDESAKMMLAFENLEVEVRERGEKVTTDVRNRIYAEVLGLEKRNQVRGFGLGVGWADVPGIVTKQRGISREKQATTAAEEKMTRMMHGANEKAEKMKREQEESIQRLKAEQEENMRLANVQMAEQLKAMLAHAGINIGSFGVARCGSSHAQISTHFEGGNDKNVQCGPPISSAMMHEDCQSENTG
ncbi:hypothetical protein D8674_038997 [Pyrus ussuriensis x Pyrus communis]|uniref:Uncharacterized protein n=1 Tax=Pyrus ussuriensis x Pyrus communis TaxID=2448454 RepID=A0A5N5FR23_9ROSA|nr:hypothetical protein D8674_039051 [Pyrus ussuriensis x Pyrus communis]KAB2620300.1 hypothetical protein D8674_038997 [Pyrus ussuriensis x Pyrus communis]